MDTNNKRRDRSVSISDIFLAIIQGWRMLLVFCIIMAIVMGIYGTYKNYKEADQNIPVESNVDELKAEMTADELAVADDLVNTITWYQNQINYYRNYNADSLFCKIDPDHIETIELQYFTGVTGIDNEAEYSSTSTALCKTYLSALNDDSVFNEMKETIDSEHDALEYRDVITIDEKYISNGIFSIKIFGYDADMISKMADIVQKYIEAKKTDAEEIYAEHDLKLMSRDYYVAGDDDFREKQLVYIYALQDVEIYIPKLKANLNLTDTQTKYVELLCSTYEEEIISENTAEVSFSLSLVNKKFVILGALIGIVIAALLIVLKYICAGKIHNSSDVENDFNLMILCGIADKTTPMRKHNTRFDRWIVKKRLRNADVPDHENAAQIIEAKLSACSQRHQMSKIVFVVDSKVKADLTIIKNVADKLSDIEEITITRDILVDGSSLKEAESADGVVLVVQSGLTSHSDIYNLKEACSCLNGYMIGAVVVE